MKKAKWVAKKLVALNDEMGNMWVCVCSSDRCIQVTRLGDEPEDKCKKGE